MESGVTAIGETFAYLDDRLVVRKRAEQTTNVSLRPLHNKNKGKKRGQLVGGDGLGSVGQTVINAKFMAKVSKFMAVN